MRTGTSRSEIETPSSAVSRCDQVFELLQNISVCVYLKHPLHFSFSELPALCLLSHQGDGHSQYCRFSRQSACQVQQAPGVSSGGHTVRSQAPGCLLCAGTLSPPARGPPWGPQMSVSQYWGAPDQPISTAASTGQPRAPSPFPVLWALRVTAGTPTPQSTCFHICVGSPSIGNAPLT